MMRLLKPVFCLPKRSLALIKFVHIPARYHWPTLLQERNLLTDEFLKNPPDALNYFLMTGALVIEGDKVKWALSHAKTFLQIYSVQFPNRSKEELDQIFGRINIELYEMFKRDLESGSPHDIDSDGYARLTGPEYPIRDNCGVQIYPRLFRRNKKEDLYHPNMNVKYDCYGFVVDRHEVLMSASEEEEIGESGHWLVDGLYCSKPRDEILVDTIKSVCGPFFLSYALLRDAADSFMTIKLLEWKGQGPAANVYGEVSAFNPKLKDPRCKSFIFLRKREEGGLPVEPGQFIPLHRPVTMTSMGYCLEVNVRIKHKNVICGDVDGDEDDLMIAEETHYFEPQCIPLGNANGEDGVTECVEMCGDWGKIVVKMYYWLPLWYF